MFRKLGDGESVTSCVPRLDGIVETFERLSCRVRFGWRIHSVPDISHSVKAEKTVDWLRG